MKKAFLVRLCQNIKSLHQKRFSTSIVSLSTPKICIVGAGPAGFYAAQHITKSLPTAEVDILEKLPVPFGLVRFGVAPDHPEVKNVINTFTKTANHPNVRYVGNITLGRDVTIQNLKDAYHSIVLTYGAEKDRLFNVPGENLQNVLSAREFVGWYNGLPSNAGFKVNLDSDVAVIFGQGNVSIDVARILLSPIDELRKTDITEHALATLAKSNVRRVCLVGRRGPLQVAFTIKELREILNLKNCQSIFNRDDFHGIQEMIPDMQRPKKRLMELLVKAALSTPKDDSLEANKIFHPIFLRSPVRFLGSSFVNAVELNINKLEGPNVFEQQAVSTAEKEVIQTELVLRSIGYQSVSVDPAIPFNEKTGRVINNGGRVEQGLYAAGWLATGPVGVILSTMSNAFETGSKVVSDINDKSVDASSKKPGFDHISSLLKQKGVQTVSFEKWERINQEEQNRGRSLGKPREKIVDVQEMLKIAE